MDDDQERLDDPAAAFEALRAEVVALRVGLDGAVARLAAPDYAPTLATIARSLAAIEAHPAMRLAPEQHRQAMAQAGGGLVREAVQALERAFQGVERERQQLLGMIGAARDQDKQFRAICWASAVALVVGLVLSPMIASVAPLGLKARFAALVMRADRWDAGAELMRTADPVEWGHWVDGVAVIRPNEAAIKLCRRAVLGKRAVRCTITIPPN